VTATDGAPVAVLGASGKTGRAVTAALLRRGVSVRGLVRAAGRLVGAPSAAPTSGAAV